MTTRERIGIQAEIRTLSRERDAVILAHNYQVPEVQDVADTVGITLNRNSIPFDDASKFNPSGVRVGTPLVTTRGMKEPEMAVIGDCIADLVERIDDPPTLDAVHERALELCRNFPIPYAFD